MEDRVGKLANWSGGDRDISMEKISNVALGLGFGWDFKTMCR